MHDLVLLLLSLEKMPAVFNRVINCTDKDSCLRTKVFLQ